jgi:hypothetical protein
MSDDRSARGRGQRRTTVSATPSPYLADLGLAELRTYRQQLTEEHDKVSYWCRLAHGRIDILEAESDTGGSLTLEDLVRVLGDTGAGNTRTTLVGVRAAEPLPDLPALDEMWVAVIDPQDQKAVTDALARLRSAERQLSSYRNALQERINDAKGQLITRYRDNPVSALIALMT